MSGYLSSRKLHNVKGRIEYITNEKKQEKIIDSYNTTDNDFWTLLAQENRERHKEVKAGGRCCEARELIIGIPQDNDITAEDICNTFKNQYNVECTCAIHENKKGDVINRHCHLIFAEREKLQEPIIEEEKRAKRNYYYNEKGRQCKKEEAVKIVYKGDIIQEGHIRHFDNKNDFFKSQQFVYECKDLFLKQKLSIEWNFEEEKAYRPLAQKHIGKNNPNAEFIKESNDFKNTIKGLCEVNDLMYDAPAGTTLKHMQKKEFVKSFNAYNIQENVEKLDQFAKDIQTTYFEEVKKQVDQHNYYIQDRFDLQHSSNEQLKNLIVEDYEPYTNTKEKKKVIEYIREKIEQTRDKIRVLIDYKIQDKLLIAHKNRVEIIEDKRENLHIEETTEKQVKKKEVEEEEEM